MKTLKNLTIEVTIKYLVFALFLYLAISLIVKVLSNPFIQFQLG